MTFYMILRRLREEIRKTPPNAVDFFILVLGGIAMIGNDVVCMGFLILVAIQRLTFGLLTQHKTINHFTVNGFVPQDTDPGVRP